MQNYRLVKRGPCAQGIEKVELVMETLGPAGCSEKGTAVGLGVGVLKTGRER